MADTATRTVSADYAEGRFNKSGYLRTGFFGRFWWCFSLGVYTSADQRWQKVMSNVGFLDVVGGTPSGQSPPVLASPGHHGLQPPGQGLL
jgi:hypothetical protein